MAWLPSSRRGCSRSCVAAVGIAVLGEAASPLRLFCLGFIGAGTVDLKRIESRVLALSLWLPSLLRF
jgi:hypothetical protein